MELLQIKHILFIITITMYGVLSTPISLNQYGSNDNDDHTVHLRYRTLLIRKPSSLRIISLRPTVADNDLLNYQNYNADKWKSNDNTYPM